MFVKIAITLSGCKVTSFFLFEQIFFKKYNNDNSMLGRKRVKRNPEKPFVVSRDFVVACCLAPFGFSASLSLLFVTWRRLQQFP